MQEQLTRLAARTEPSEPEESFTDRVNTARSTRDCERVRTLAQAMVDAHVARVEFDDVKIELHPSAFHAPARSLEEQRTETRDGRQRQSVRAGRHR